MNTQQLRHALKVKWLLYYRQNRPWLTRIKIWGTYEGKRRPSSSFILATLTHLEPQLIEMLPFIVSLSNNPDQIMVALGLNFNPEEELKSLTEAASVVELNTNGNGKPQTIAIVKTNANGNGSSGEILPKVNSEVNLPTPTQTTNLPSWVDETCKGVGWNRHNLAQ